MTNKEAIKIATGLRTDFKCESDTMVDFCNTVIEALEQEPCEDAVSRKYLLDKIHSENEMDKIENSNLFAVHYANLIKNAPPVTPTVECTCINYEDGCEEWAGCPCVYCKPESEGK